MKTSLALSSHKCSSVGDNSSSSFGGASYPIHTSTHLRKVHVWSSGSRPVEAQVSCSGRPPRCFDAGEWREDLWFHRFLCYV